MMTKLSKKSRVLQTPHLTGVIDFYRDGALYGWARDANQPDIPISLCVYIDGKFKNRILANLERPDLREAGIGDGRHGFQLSLHSYVKNGAQEIDLRFSGTKLSIARSPISINETYIAHQKKLVNFLDSGPFWLSDFNFDGNDLVVEGFYHPRNGDLSEVTITADGCRPYTIEWQTAAATADVKFWFLSPKSSGFKAIFDLGAMPANLKKSAVEIELLDPKEALGEFRRYYLPISIAAYKNVPDAIRQKRVMGWDNDARFVMLGRTHYETNKSLSALHGTPVERMERVLDWGVGCGRIARHFIENHPNLEVHGVDIDSDNVQWCSTNLQTGKFVVGPLLPPLPYPDNYFDLIHANSVFTHLTEDVQDLWLRELSRILKPSGIVLATIHSNTAVAYARMPLDWIETWENSGINSIGVNRDLVGFVNDSDYYRNTYHTYSYIEQHWARSVDVLAIHKHLFGYQDVVAFRKYPQAVTSKSKKRPVENKAPEPFIAFDNYIDILIRAVSNTIYSDVPFGTWGDVAFDEAKRNEGKDWPSSAHSMAGTLRLRNTADLVKIILREGIPGDFIETGVWRGGNCILMRGLLAAWGDRTRVVFCADSFRGLPAPNDEKYPADRGDTLFKYDELAVSKESVMANFNRYGLLDNQVKFLEGWFKETLPKVRGKQFALIRLDGDMYESTQDALENLYDTVPVGGFIVVDDYGAIKACKQAVTDFRNSRNIIDPITSVDWTGVWWRKSKA